jgi:hypothetical protein
LYSHSSSAELRLALRRKTAYHWRINRKIEAGRMSEEAKSLDEMLTGFDPDYDLDLLVCCRGETGHGPLGVRRWTVIVVNRTPTHEEIDRGALPDKFRIQTACHETPRQAVEEARRRVDGGEIQL